MEELVSLRRLWRRVRGEAAQPLGGARPPGVQSNGTYPSLHAQWTAQGQTVSTPLGDASPSDRREFRWALRAFLWAKSMNRAVRACGRCRRKEASAIGVRFDAETKRAGYSGLQSCGSVWVCPSCNARIMAERALELGAAVEEARKRGMRLVFATWTIRHEVADDLADLWAVLGKCWAYMASGKSWAADREAYGVEGHVRITEGTVGLNGWHMHFHALLFIAPGLVDSDVDLLRRSMQHRWKKRSKALGHEALDAGLDWRVVETEAWAETLASYMAKATAEGAAAAKAKRDTARKNGNLAQELTNSQSKRARNSMSTRSVWELLDEARTGIAGSMERWWVWETASKGKRQIAWSRGLRKLLGLGEQRKDDEIAADEFGKVEDTVAWITDDGWRQMVRGHRMAAGLDAVERGGLVGLRDFLVRHGIEHELVSTDV